VAFKVGNQTVLDIDGSGGTKLESALDKDVVLYPGIGGEIYIGVDTSLVFEGSSPPDNFEGRVKATTLTADRRYTLPDHLYEVSGGGVSQGMIAVLDVTAFPTGDIATYVDGINTATNNAYILADTAVTDAYILADTAVTDAYILADIAVTDAFTAAGVVATGAYIAADALQTTALQGYTDVAEADAISTSNSYTDGRETAITTAYQSYTDVAEADAISTSNSYTDGRETAITTAYQSYANTAEADAISTSNLYTDGKTTKAYIDALNIQAASVNVNSVALGTDTTGNYVATVAGTVNEIAVTGSGSETSAVTVGLTTDVTITNNLTIGGDLFVTGSTISVGSANLSVDDSFIYLNQGDAIGVANTVFTGAGLDDGVLGGYFEGTTSVTYYVRIDANGTPDTFEWSKDNFVTTVATGIAIDGTDQALDNNITIKFSATTGHTIGDAWSGLAAPVNIDTGIFSNINTGTTGVGYTHVGVFFDASTSSWKVFSEYDPEPNGTVNTGHASFTLGKMEADCFIANDVEINGTITNANHATDKLYVDTADTSAIATASADATTKANAALAAALAADTDTTYSVGDGGLTQVNFTTADNTKLDGIATSANNYVHPASHAISFITGLQTALDGKVDDSQVLTNVPSGALFTDTTYSVGDGGLTQVNFTTADNTKLDGIATSANNYVHPASHAISFITGLQTALDGKVDDSQVLTNVPAGAVFTDTNATYSVGDGGLTQVNFTTADNTKLDGIATSANNYVHPASHAISFITGLQTALNAKVDDSQVLTNVPAGAVFTNTTYSSGNGLTLTGTTFTMSGAYTGTFGVTGDITASGDVTAYSDIRFKHNVETITNAVDTVNNLRGVMFEKDNRHSTGVIAQEVEAVFPEVVHTNAEGLKSVAYGNMVGLLIEAVKEQQLQITALQEEINNLKK
jgi:hypothetical protein